MRRRHGAAERIGQCRIDPARLRQVVEGRILVETAHLDSPFDRRAGAVEREPAVRLARDRHDAAIDFRRERPVDLELGLAGLLALVEGRIVEERKAHRAFDLEGAGAGQEYRGGMGVDALDRRSAMGRGFGQQGENRFLRFALVHPCRNSSNGISPASVLPASSHVNAGAPGTVHRALRGAFTAPDAVGRNRDARRAALGMTGSRTACYNGANSSGDPAMRANDGTRTAAEVLIDQLVIHGVRHMFCVPGESYIAALDACHDRDIAVTVCRQESGAAIMAEAQGKATGRPGICFVTRGPGATNAAAGVHIARQDSTPMILFVGQIAREMREREAFQELDYRAVFGTMAKWATEIDDPTRIPELVSRAFYTATSGRPGPVVIALPEDMLVERIAVPDAPAFEPVETWPGATDMSRLQKLLWAAERPIVLLGGSRWSERGLRRGRALRASALRCRSRPRSGARICSIRTIPATPAISASGPIPSSWRA